MSNLDSTQIDLQKKAKELAQQEFLP